MRLPALALPACALLALVAAARADGPRDNLVSDVRPIPPPGVAVPAEERARLDKELSALERSLVGLRANKAALAALPDVEIFAVAVRTALTYNEFFADADIKHAHELLALGSQRAGALEKGDTPWLSHAGLTVLGFRSQLDGSVQPYGLAIPPSWVPPSPHRFRLDTWFHGRDEQIGEIAFLSRALRDVGPFVRPDAFTLAPYARYSNGCKFAGEVDTFEALDDVKRRFRIDEDRVVIRGFSLGGASTWQLAAHHASDWAAAAPGAGFAESRKFLEFFQSEKLTPPWWEETLWQLYDAPAYAENFRNVPLVAYSGEIDRQKQAADLMTTVLAGVGITLTHVIGPQTAHKYHPDAIVTLNGLVDALADRGRDPLPAHVSLVTPTLKYNRQGWITVDALGAHWEKAEVEGSWQSQLESSEIRLKTRNVTALSLNFPSGRSPLFPGMPLVIRLDGQSLTGLTAGSDRSFHAAFHRAGGRWWVGPDSSAGLHKRHNLQGPIDDGLLASFLMVTPTGTPLFPALAPWVEAEQKRALAQWRRQFRGEARVKRDQDITPADMATHNLILWGDPGSNRVLATLHDRLPIRWNRDGIQVGKKLFSPDHHALITIYPNPAAPSHYIVVNSGFTFREYDQLNNARQTPKLPDWAVVDISTPPDSRWPGKVVAADFYGERWEVKTPGHRP